ncbi:hypothetical protein HY008_00035 [Candidatus Woesebacteria bacterium]|nr:hypothetical protein [Candidatus Woesebacteria bacterium]
MKKYDTRTDQAKSDDRVKGKLAEAIVAEMLTRADYVVRQLGYENIMQDLDRKSSLWQHLSSEGSTIESTPDLAILNNAHHLLCFLEVKYRSVPDQEELIRTIEKLSSRWQRTHILVVTPQNPSFVMMYR